MGYLYGDLTPFPVDINYIDVIRDGIDLCQTLLRIDASIEELRRQTEQERKTVAENLTAFKQVATDLATALEPHATGERPAVKEVATRLIQSARGVLEQAQHALVQRRDASARQAAERIRAERNAALPALQTFLLRHELANTTWTVHWSAGGEPPTAESKAIAMTPFGLEAAFRIEVPPDSRLAGPVRVGELREGLSVELPKKARRGTTTRRVDLDRYYITVFSVGQQSARMFLRKSLKTAAAGFEVRWQGEDPALHGLDDSSFPDGPAAVDGADLPVVRELRHALEPVLFGLVQHRESLTGARVSNEDVAELDSPLPVAKLLLKAIGPYSREIIQRSPVEGELSLKRVVEDGRREEVFIAASELTKMFAPLPADRRTLFKELGLSVPGPAPSAAPAPPLEMVTEPEPAAPPAKQFEESVPTIEPDLVELEAEYVEETTKQSMSDDEELLLRKMLGPDAE